MAELGIGLIILIVLIVGIVGIGLWAIGVYNGLIKTKNRVDEAWSDIDVQLKRRYDLIPNLINTVKGYAKHESETLEKVTKARQMAIDASNLKEQQEAENMLTSTLRSLFAVSENYPDLKANTNFLELQRELSDTENKIMASRRFYNGNVRDFNTKLQVFPSNIAGNILGFKSRDYFEIEDPAEKEAPQVDFGTK
jgi:LemA protein